MNHDVAARASVRGTAAAHAKVIRADGRIEHYSSFSRPRPWWNIPGWLWLAARWLEYKRMEKADG
jgi:hypothetical protein